MKSFTPCLYLSLLVIFNSQIAFSQWEWSHPCPQGNTLNDIYFIDQNIGWAVGDAGTILRSTDGGLNYEPMNYSSHANFTSVEFFNTDIGLVAGDSGIILKTIDGGLDWERLASGCSATISDLCIVDSGIAWFIGTDGSVMKSTDLAESWQIQFYDPNMSFSQMCFSDNKHGWVIGRDYNEFIRTNDGGNSWDTIEIPNSYELFDLFFTDSLKGWMSMSDLGDQKIAKTSDGGNSWELVGEVYGQLLSVFFTDQDHGWFVGNSNTVPLRWGWAYFTNDGGDTWNAIDFHDDHLWGDIKNIYFTDRWHGWLAGTEGMLSCTSDGGQNWEVICTSDDVSGIFNDILFMDDLNGWAVGGNFYPFQSHILHTEDGGNTWTRQGDINHIPLSIFFIDLHRGWMIGDPSLADYTTAILRTTDGGSNWVTQYSQDYHEGMFSDIYFKNSMKGWAVGQGGNTYPPPDISLFYLTLDGGTNWIDQSYMFNRSLSSICFTDQDHGWIAGYKTILKTTNGGQSWSEVWTGPHYLKDIFFIDNEHGWALGDSAARYPYRDVIMRTTDAGMTWEQQFPGFGSSLKKVFFTDNDHGWIARDGDILYTVDGGVTWKHMYINFNGELGGIFFSDIDHGWVVGQNNAIFHIDNGSIVDVKEPEFNIQHPTFNISCFPNPTGGISHFSIHNSQYQWVTIAIFDLQGQEMAIVLDKKLSAGEYTVHFDTSGLPAGIYFVRVTAGEETATEKMVVMR
jgi:photosystem II stability/assembly factor-like uncharacterized protein